MTFKTKRKHQAAPAAKDWAQAEAIFAQIPDGYQRDRVLFRLMFTCRLKAFEAVRLRREDMVITEHQVQFTLRDLYGQPGRTIHLSTDRLVHAILIDDLRAYLLHTGYTTGPVFCNEGERIRPRTGCPRVTQQEPVDRTEFRRDGQPLTLALIHERWQQYVKRANSTWTLKELRAG